jgi:uncharacterized protein (DUF488 family)
MKVYTIGFTQTTAESFFTRLSRAGVCRVIDVRLNNESQLAGFAKRKDLQYFCRTICNIDYVHLTDLAPTANLLDAYKKGGGSWTTYEREFTDLIAKRRIEDSVSKELMDGGCLLCSEAKPEHCHRRLVAEYLRARWHDMNISHL